MKQLEAPIHKAIVQYLRATLPHGWIVQSTPNKPRSKVAGSIEKSMGAVKGWPDIAVYGIREREVFYGDIDDRLVMETPAAYFLEVKEPKGRVRESQTEVHDRLTDLGFQVAVVRSVDDVRACVKEWGLPSKDAALNDNKDTWISLGDAVNGVIGNIARGNS